MTRRVRRRGALAVVAVAALVTGACSAGRSPAEAFAAPSAVTGSPSSAGPLPERGLAAVGAEIRQSRADWGDRVVQVRVRNDGAAPLTVTRAELTVATADGAAVSDRGWVREVPAGSHRDASVASGPPVCGVGADPAARVRLGAADGTGRTGTVTVSPADPQGHLARIHGEDCAAAAVARGLRVEPVGDLGVAERDGLLVATVTLALTPVAGGPPVTLDRVDGTVLVAPVGGAAWTSPAGPGPVRAPSTVALDLTPGRCDAHAVAEDKRGSYLGLHTTVDGVAQPVFYLALGEDRRGALHDYIARACGWPDA